MADAPLTFSESWYRIAQQRVSLRSHVKVRRQLFRGERWYVLQDPFNIGYTAVKTMAAHLKGEKVERRIDTGSKLVTRENMDQAEVKALLQPDLKSWLGE